MINIGFLYFRLKQVLKSTGSDLVIREQGKNDEFIVYYNLIGSYIYVGDRETYKSKTCFVLSVPYYNGFPGGPIKYLDLWEVTTNRLENILSDKVY